MKKITIAEGRLINKALDRVLTNPTPEQNKQLAVIKQAVLDIGRFSPLRPDKEIEMTRQAVNNGVSDVSHGWIFGGSAGFERACVMTGITPEYIHKLFSDIEKYEEAVT